MYSSLPTTSRRLVKGALSVAWSSAGGAGLSSVLLSPVSFVRELGLTWTLVFGAGLAVAAAFAVVGVLGGRYRWEWIASYLASACMVPYAVLLWGTVALGRETTMPQAFIASALVAFFLLRGFLCAAHAAILRTAHVVAAAAIRRTLTEGENDAGGTG